MGVRRYWEAEETVDSGSVNDLYGDSLPGYETVQERQEDWFQPVTNLRGVEETRQPPELGQGSVIGEGADRFFGVWNGSAWVPWRRISAVETGLIQVVITDTAVEESLTGSVLARFQVYLVNAEATLSNFTDPRFRLEPADLGGRGGVL